MFQLVKLTKTGFQNIRIQWRNHHLLLSFCRKKKKQRLWSNQNKELSKWYVIFNTWLGIIFALITASIGACYQLYFVLVLLIFLFITSHTFSMRCRFGKFVVMSDCGDFTAWFLLFTSLPPNRWPLIPKWKVHFPFIRKKKYLGPLAKAVLLLIGPVEMFPQLVQAQKWFDPRNPTVSVNVVVF